MRRPARGVEHGRGAQARFCGRVAGRAAAAFAAATAVAAFGVPSADSSDTAPAPRAQAATGKYPAIEEVLGSVSPAEMWTVVERFATLDRTSSTPGERRAVEFLMAALERLGIPHRLHEVRSYLSLPVRASLNITAPEALQVPALTPSFSVSTARGGVRASLIYVGPDDPAIITSRPQDFERSGGAARGRIVLLRGYPSPELIEAAAGVGAIGAVCIAPSPRLVNMIVSTVWGHPGSAGSNSPARLPVVSVTEADGARLEALARAGPVEAALETETDTGWKTIPLLVAEVRGTAEPEEYVLVANHIDAWHEGVTDSATGNGMLLEIARLAHARRAALRRSLRLAWWPGHSTGRYSGSTWYADTFHDELREHAVAYLASDSPGVRAATEIEPEGMYELKGFLEGALRAQGVLTREATRSWRYNDESFWGIGVPSLTFYPAIPKGHPDRAKDAGGSAYGWWWHTKEDALDKADRDLLVRDTRLFLALLWPLLTREVLPFDFTPVAAQMRETIAGYEAAARGRWDFGPTRGRIAAFEKAATALAGRAAGARGPQARRANDAFRRISRALNPVLYTRRGPYEHDPAVMLPLFPGLAGAERLGTLDPGSEEAGFIRTDLRRESNRVHAALDSAVEVASSAMNGRFEKL